MSFNIENLNRIGKTINKERNGGNCRINRKIKPMDKDLIRLSLTWWGRGRGRGPTPPYWEPLFCTALCDCHNQCTKHFAAAVNISFKNGKIIVLEIHWSVSKSVNNYGSRWVRYWRKIEHVLVLISKLGRKSLVFLRTKIFGFLKTKNF